MNREGTDVTEERGTDQMNERRSEGKRELEIPSVSRVSLPRLSRCRYSLSVPFTRLRHRSVRDAGRYARLPTLTVSPLAARGLRPEAEPARVPRLLTHLGRASLRSATSLGSFVAFGPLRGVWLRDEGHGG